ncbi:ATP-binding protein [uncultured Cohaesibacter sp.]|uniref:ATP-binding protein n=1 Tax=uncultured Cohaesibacter sp. TaxID=1002546 RepID=UPI00293001C5|nr:ATP-binding protein [uncultured Cohaesibacter sp.]
MKKALWFDFINSIAGQLLILLILATVLFLSGIYISIQAARDAPLAPPVMLFSERQIGIAEVLSLEDPGDYRAHLEELKKRHPKVTYKLHPKGESLGHDLVWAKGRHIVDKPLSAAPGAIAPAQLFREPRDRIREPGEPGFFGVSNPQEVSLVISRRVEKNETTDIARVTLFALMPSEEVLSASIEVRAGDPPNHLIENTLVFTVVCMLLLLFWAIVFLIRPLRKLASVTNNIAKEDVDPKKVDVTGPTELRAAASALNKMQERIHHLIDDRTRMLAAVGHDLRTPVTRLRLRADTVEPEEDRAAFLRDLNMMDGLLSRLMAYFSKRDLSDEPVRLELSSLVHSLACEWSDAGNPVEITELTNVTIRARPNDVMRMVDNLIDNAIKYAGSCELSLTKEGDFACLKVIDHGPGIPQEEKMLLQQPFARGDKARTMNGEPGFGLGLAIASKVAESHDATLDLLDTEGGGLKIVVRFPLSE